MLDTVYNTETILYVQSTTRASGYPTANYYQIPLTVSLGGVKEVHLTHFLPAAGITGPYLLQVVEFTSARSYAPGFISGPVHYIVFPGHGSQYYMSDLRDNDTIIFPRERAPNINSLTFSWYNLDGTPATDIPEHLLRFYIRSHG
jgi:hypothetical protein